MSHNRVVLATAKSVLRLLIAPTLCVGAQPWTLRVCLCDAERHRRHSHAERGNELKIRARLAVEESAATIDAIPHQSETIHVA